MCGIAGEIRFDGRPADREAVQKITDYQLPRGPDGKGLFVQGPVALGHRRLKIIDLSERAAQPMQDQNLGLTVVFNGCIYNHRELKSELEKLGHVFSSTSDTEVVLKSYAEWGKHCVERFNGMFALAAYQSGSGSLFIARDRLGIKPFYYQLRAGSFRFASSLPALLAADDGGADLDEAALHHYLTFHSVVPAPRTIIRSVRKLPPATRVTITAHGRTEAEMYWAPSFSRDADADHDFDVLKERLLEELSGAVSRRMVADVPVGVLLSGGVDSSLVVGLLSQLGASGLNTFTIGFEDAGGEAGNEFPYSDLIAEEFATEHHKIQISSTGLVDRLPECFKAMAEPMVSHDNIAFYLLSEEVSRHVKVVQSGQGADEIFGGYFWYPPLLESDDVFADYSRAFFDRDHREMHEVVEPGLLDFDHSADFVRRHFEFAQADEPVDKALHIDTTVMLVDDPVKRVDNMTMAWGLEARVPFLDHELVEFAAGIPPELKVGGDGKHILKEAAREVLPSEVIDRKKGYFPVPELKHLNGASLAYVKDKLNSQDARERGIFQRSYLDRLLDEPENHLTPLNGSKLWQVATLESWLQTHNI
ncbi:MAG: N-acetylglutaminylglutamine amidotransferase [Gammaproteobacteria bacterium]|jgi:asparagine synthase (glutamine-hydrolysing)